MKFIEAIKKICLTGCDRLRDAALIRSVRIVNTGSLIAATATPLLSLYFILSANYVQLWSGVPFISLFCALIYLNHRGLHRTSRFMFLLFANLGILLGVFMYGADSGLSLLFLCTILFAYTIYQSEEPQELVLFTLLPIGLFGVVDIFADDLFQGKISFPADERKHISMILKSFSLAMVASSCYVIYRIIAGMRQRLMREEERRIEQAKLLGLAAMGAGIAHEINNPLAIIRGRVEQALYYIDHPQADPGKMRQLHENMLKHLERIAAIVKSLKRLARKSDEDVYEAFALNDIVEDCLQLCRESLKAREGRLIYEPPHERLMVRCRPSEIMQVMINLINNSMDAISSLPEKWIRVALEGGNGQVVIRVIDSGPGIAPDIRSRIMEPFFTTKDVGKGIGVGLSIAAAIIKNHGGTLAIDAHHTHTCFEVTLPQVEDLASDAKQSHHSKNARAR